MLTALGDRLLARLLPSTTAAAAICRGRYMGMTGSCHYWCYQSGARSQQLRRCQNESSCIIACNDCC